MNTNSDMRILFLSAILVLLMNSADSVSQITWERTSLNGSSFFHLTTTRDSCTVSTGRIWTSTDYRLFLEKRSRYGELVWSTVFDSNSNNGSAGFWVEETLDGGIIVTGYYSIASTDILLMKLNSQGIIQWYKTFGSSDVDQGYCIKQTSDKGFIVQCRVNSFSSNNDIMIIKTDSLGNLQWQKLFDYAQDFLPSDMLIYNAGRYLFSGGLEALRSIGTRQNKTHCNRSERRFVVEQRAQSSKLCDFTYSSVVSSSGRIIIAGELSFENKSFVMELDSLGNKLREWTFQYPGISDRARFIAESKGRGYVLCSNAYTIFSPTTQNGNRYKDEGQPGFAILRLIGYDGELKFEKVRGFGSYTLRYESIANTYDGGFAISGYFYNSSEVGGYTVKTDSSGEFKPSLVMHSNEEVRSLKLFQNFPNPFNSSTVLRYSILQTSDIAITVFDIAGKLLFRSNNKRLAAGDHTFSLAVDKFASSSGILLYKIEAKNNHLEESLSGKMLYLK
ncbi:MAG: T9SS type A sorting domain-containing protein [Ignavibacteria bacterium]|nr:T9SS type A sorting domain-containing protein [Ignavibacteria bacterium]